MTTEKNESNLSTQGDLEMIRKCLFTTLAPSFAHYLRGVLNGVVLSQELVRAAATRSGDAATIVGAVESLITSTGRYGEAIETFLNQLVLPDPGASMVNPELAAREVVALVSPHAKGRKISIRLAPWPATFPVSAIPGQLIPAMAFAAVEVVAGVAEGGSLLVEASAPEGKPQIAITGAPSLAVSRHPLPIAARSVVSAMGASVIAVETGSGSGFIFGLPGRGI